MDSGYMPVLKSVSENKGFANFLNSANGTNYLKAMAIKVGIQERDTYFTSDVFNGSAVARTQVGALLNKVIGTKLENGLTIDKLIDDAFTEAMDECIFQAG